MTKKDAITVYFGGDAKELWTGDGLHIVYSGRLAALARRDGSGQWRAEAHFPACSGNVKPDYNAASKEQALAARLNTRDCPDLTLAYFQTAANAGEALLSSKMDAGALPCLSTLNVRGGLDALILPELLRLLLDEWRLSWGDSVDIISNCTIYMAKECLCVPLPAIAALTPRSARLIEAVDEKLRGVLRDAFPGDWRRMESGAILSENTVDLGRLSAVMCGRVICAKELKAGNLRTLYTVMPGKFEEDS